MAQHPLLFPVQLFFFNHKKTNYFSKIPLESRQPPTTTQYSALPLVRSCFVSRTMHANIRCVHRIAQVHLHTLRSSSRVLTSYTFDFLNQFLPFAPPNSVSLDSINSYERRQIAVGFSKIVKSQKIYVLKAFSREFCPYFLVDIMKLLGTRETAFAFFKLAFRDDSDRILESCCVAVHILASENLHFLSQDIVSFVIGRIGAGKCRNLVEFMWENHHLYESDFSILNTLMRGFLNVEMGSEALEVVIKMREVGVSPTSSASRILLKLLLRIGDYGSAWKFFREMVRKGPFPTTHTFNMMILGFCRKGLLRIGESLLHVMRKFRCEPDVFTYNIVINANCLRGETSNVLEWMHFMISSGCKPNVVTFNTVINALCKEGEMVKARRFFDGILDVGISPNTITYNIMIDGYVKAGDLVQAEKLYEEMRHKGISPDGMTFNILIACHHDYGREMIWCRLLRDLAIPGFFQNKSLFDVLVASLCWQGRMDEAMEAAENMLERGFPLSVVAFNSVIAAYSKAGLDEKAYRAYKILTRFGLIPSSSTCSYLLLGLCKKRHLNEARELLCKMVEKGFPINKLAFLVLIDGYFRVGDPKGARNLWKEMHRGGMFPDAVAFAVFINGLARVGLMEAYEMLLEEARERFGPSNFAYDSLIHWFYNHGKLNQKLMLGREMRQKGLSSGYLCDQYRYSRFHSGRMNFGIL